MHRQRCRKGFALIDAGHFATEYPGMVELGSRLRRIAAKAEWDAIFMSHSVRPTFTGKADEAFRNCVSTLSFF